MSTVPEWNADIVTPYDNVDLAANGGLGLNEDGAVEVKVDGSTIVVNQDGELEANIPTPETVDQEYDAESTHAQSGVAIAGALADYTPTASLATVATSGIYDDLQDKPTIPSLNVFVATYGTTTYQELSDAHTAGKAIFVTGVSGALSAVIPMASFNTSPAMVMFSAVIGSSEYRAKIDQDVWSSTTVSTQADWNESSQVAPSYIANKPTVDQTYDASSTNAQSGTAVAGAISGVRQVPSTQSSDNGKVLGVTDTSGTLGWVAQPTLASLNSAGITDVQQLAALPASPVATVLYLIPET